MIFGFNNFNRSQFNSFKKSQYNKIYAHEAQHKAKGGSLAGPIVIEKDSRGVAVAGHVDIKMPSIDKTNPDNTIKDAKTVISSALAPFDPSSQDLKVAGEAKTILAQAQKNKNDKQKDEHKLNYYA